MINLVAVAKNEELYIKDWYEWHKNKGFDNIIVYDNGGNGIINGLELINFKEVPAPQLKAYQDYIMKMPLNDWVLFIDIDEFYDGPEVHEFLKPFENCDCVRLNWKVYGDCEQIKYEEKPVWERFPDPSPIDCLYNDTISGVTENLHIKNFYHRTFKPAQAGVHNTMVAGGCAVNTKFEVENGLSPFQEVCWETAFIRHYLTKSTEEWCERRLNKIDATGNGFDINNQRRWYFNLNTITKEKQDIVDAYIKGNTTKNK